VDSLSTGGITQQEPTPDAYTLPEWLTIYNNGARVPSSHPQYQEVRGLMEHALQQITVMHHQQHLADIQDADLHPYSPGAGTSFAAGAAQGMSLGLGGALSPDFSQELGQARQDHPVATGAGNVVGGAIPAAIGAGMPAFAGAPLVPGAIGAGIQGTLEQGPGTGALAAGATLIGGKILGKAASMVGLDKVAGRADLAIAAKLGVGAEGAAAAEGEQAIRGIPVSQLRQRLLNMGVASGDVENAVQAAMRAHVQEQALGGRAAADATSARPQVKGTMGPLAPQAKEPLDQPAFLRNAAQQHSVEDIKGALAEGVKTGGTPAGAIMDLQAKLGRALSAQEKEQVLAKQLLGGESPHDQSAAARSAYNLTEAAGQSKKAATAAGRRAAGTHSTWDPRQGL